MSRNVATLAVWMTLLEDQHEGSARKAAAHYGIDASYWWRLKQGEKESPSQEVLDKLGLRVSSVLYERRP